MIAAYRHGVTHKKKGAIVANKQEKGVPGTKETKFKNSPQCSLLSGMYETEIYVALLQIQWVFPLANHGEIFYVIGLNQPHISSILNCFFRCTSFL